MKRLFLLLLLSLPFFDAVAQIEVESFRALPNDMTAKSLKGTKRDQNGKVCALIKVVTTETDFIFDGGSLGIVETAQKPGEIWVWVPPLSRKITISHAEYGVLREYNFNHYDIESGCTYELVLKTPKIEPEPVLQVVEEPHKCILIINSDRIGDLIFLNDTIVGGTPLSIAVKSGQYEVKVKREGIEELQSVVVEDENDYKQLIFSMIPPIVEEPEVVEVQPEKKSRKAKRDAEKSDQQEVSPDEERLSPRMCVSLGYGIENTYFGGFTFNVGLSERWGMALGPCLHYNTKDDRAYFDLPVLFNYRVGGERFSFSPFIGPLFSINSVYPIALGAMGGMVLGNSYLKFNAGYQAYFYSFRYQWEYAHHRGVFFAGLSICF